MNKWLLGIPYELAFWEATYANKTTQKSVLSFDNYGKQIHLDGYDVVDFLSKQPADAKVLDVGCGMSFRTGDFLLKEGKKVSINLHYIDPLAQFYNKIANTYQVQVPKVEFGMMEYLSAFYPEQDVTLIIIQNALDHSNNPLKGIIEALHSLKIGGVLYLNHHPNEAEFENYRGFHQFNITVEDGSLIIWNKTTRYNINDLIDDFAHVEATIYEGNPIAVITKNKNVPNEILDYQKDIRTLSEALLAYSEQVNSAKFMFRYNIKLMYYRLGQRVSKLFSWRTRQRIKQLVKI